MMAIAAITGLVAEARIARHAGLRAAAAGGSAAHTKAAVERLIADGAMALVSFGICGGLDPALASGALVLPHTIRGEGGEYYLVDKAWHEDRLTALSAAGIIATTGDVLGATAIADTPARKAALHRKTGAVAVDLESHLVARAAQAARLPFLVVRAIADPADRALPPAALVGLDSEGRPALLPILSALARNPGQLPSLLQVALDSRRGLSTLRRIATLGLGPNTAGTTWPEPAAVGPHA